MGRKSIVSPPPPPDLNFETHFIEAFAGDIILIKSLSPSTGSPCHVFVCALLRSKGRRSGVRGSVSGIHTSDTFFFLIIVESLR